MSFIGSNPGLGFAAGHFLADDENCTRVTAQVPANHADVVTNDDGSKFVPVGVLIEGVGLLYEPIDVSKGDAPGSVVTGGRVYLGKLHGTGKAAFGGDTPTPNASYPGIIPVAAPVTTRPFPVED